MGHDIFISYTKEDKLTADAVSATLESRYGIRCWIAPRDICPGADWAESIVLAISDSRAFVLIFSAHANQSQQVKKEVERAVNKGIPIIPFRIEDVEPNKTLEYFISTPHWLEAFTPPLEIHINHLAQTLSVMLDKTKPMDGSFSETANSQDFFSAHSSNSPEDPISPRGQKNRRLLTAGLLLFIFAIVVVGSIVFAIKDKPDHGETNKQVNLTPSTELAQITEDKDSHVEISYWNSIANSIDPKAFQAYLQRYPNGKFNDLAKLKLEDLIKPKIDTKSIPQSITEDKESQIEISYWNSIVNSTDPKSFHAYLQRYPNGKFVDLAKLKIDGLEKNKIDHQNKIHGEEKSIDNSLSIKKEATTNYFIALFESHNNFENYIFLLYQIESLDSLGELENLEKMIEMLIINIKNIKTNNVDRELIRITDRMLKYYTNIYTNVYTLVEAGYSINNYGTTDIDIDEALIRLSQTLAESEKMQKDDKIVLNKIKERYDIRINEYNEYY